MWKKLQKGKKKEYPASPILEFVEGSGIIYSAVFAYSPSELRKVDYIPTNAAFVTEDSRYKANNGESTDDFVRETGYGVVVLHVCSNRQDSMGSWRARSSSGVAVEFVEV